MKRLFFGLMAGVIVVAAIGFFQNKNIIAKQDPWKNFQKEQQEYRERMNPKKPNLVQRAGRAVNRVPQRIKETASGIRTTASKARDNWLNRNK